MTRKRLVGTTRQGLEKSAHKRPKDMETVVVEGGNHRGFAHYTRQPLDWEVRREEGEL